MTVNRPSEATRDRILLASVEIFARAGFKEATIREICAKADVNIASINYHFRNKASLYAEALAFAFRQADQRYPMKEAKDERLSPEQRLTAFVHVFMSKLTDESNLGYHGKLISREIADPTDALDDIVKIAIVPQFAILRQIIPQLLNNQTLSGTEIQRFILCILGQCLVYKHSRSIIDRICPEVIIDSEAIQQSADHIVRFTLAAFRQFKSS